MKLLLLVLPLAAAYWRGDEWVDPDLQHTVWVVVTASDNCVPKESIPSTVWQSLAPLETAPVPSSTDGAFHDLPSSATTWSELSPSSSDEATTHLPEYTPSVTSRVESAVTAPMESLSTVKTQEPSSSTVKTQESSSSTIDTHEADPTSIVYCDEVESDSGYSSITLHQNSTTVPVPTTTVKSVETTDVGPFSNSTAMSSKTETISSELPSAHSTASSVTPPVTTSPPQEDIHNAILSETTTFSSTEHTSLTTSEESTTTVTVTITDTVTVLRTRTTSTADKSTAADTDFDSTTTTTVESHATTTVDFTGDAVTVTKTETSTATHAASE